MLNALKQPEIRNKILFSLLVIFLFRFLAHVPVPFVDLIALRSLFNANPLLGLFDVFSGGGFQNFSVVSLGLNPYVTGSIIIQMLTFMFPSLEAMQKEGEQGREKLNMYSRLLALPISLFQAYGLYFLLNRQGVIPQLDVWSLSILIATLTAGTMLLMWIGELVTEYGVGQGISLLIFAGIISSLPTTFTQIVTTLNSDNIFSFLILGFSTFLLVMGVVYANEGTRNIKMEYGRKGIRSESVVNYLPIKINNAGVIPIIFAVSLVILPSMLAPGLQSIPNQTVQEIGLFLARNFTSTSLLYNVLYFLLIIAFTYFYTSIQFNPEKISDDLKKRGGYIAGIRPGKATTMYLAGIINRITLVGAVFLGLIAVMPYILSNFINTSNYVVGGTSLLIVVSVIIETLRQIQSLTVSRNYNSFLD